MEAGVTHGKIEILAYVRVQAHNIHKLDCLVFLHFIVETHGLRPAPVQSFARTQQTMSYYKICQQFGFLLKFTFPLKLDQISRSCYLL